MLSLAGGAPVLSQPRQVIKLATAAGAGSPQAQQLYALAAELEAHTDGAAQTKIFPGGRIGAGAQLLKRVQTGEVQVAALPFDVLSEAVPSLAVLSAPFVFRDHAQADRALDRHAPSILRTELAEAELHFVTPGVSVMEHWFVAGDVPSSPKDLTGYAVWGRNSPAERLEWRALGLSPLPADATPAQQSLWFRATAMEARLSGRDLLCTKVVRAEDVLSGNLVVMSQRWFDGLPERVKTALDRMKSHTVEDARKSARDLDEALLSRMRERGLEVVDLPGASRRRFHRHGRAVQHALGNEIGFAAQRLLLKLRGR